MAKNSTAENKTTNETTLNPVFSQLVEVIPEGQWLYEGSEGSTASTKYTKSYIRVIEIKANYLYKSM